MHRKMSSFEEIPVFSRANSFTSMSSGGLDLQRDDCEEDEVFKTSPSQGRRLRSQVHGTDGLLPQHRYRFVGVIDDVAVLENPDAIVDNEEDHVAVHGSIFILHDAIVIAGSRDDIDQTCEGWVPGLVDTDTIQHRFRAGAEIAAEVAEEELRGVVSGEPSDKIREDDSKSKKKTNKLNKAAKKAKAKAAEARPHEDSLDLEDEDKPLELIYMLKLSQIKLSPTNDDTSRTLRFRYALRTRVRSKSSGRMRVATHIVAVELDFLTHEHAAEFKRQFTLCRVKETVAAERRASKASASNQQGFSSQFATSNKGVISQPTIAKPRKWNRERAQLRYTARAPLDEDDMEMPPSASRSNPSNERRLSLLRLAMKSPNSATFKTPSSSAEVRPTASKRKSMGVRRLTQLFQSGGAP
mmetsp:Transcript_4097/g.8841  ORF Transcript_4097/g.8841 Transcript_4097/m.8841 type:complete len:411 (+) Transcript_4097:1094-2326(+)